MSYEQIFFIIVMALATISVWISANVAIFENPNLNKELRRLNSVLESKREDITIGDMFFVAFFSIAFFSVIIKNKLHDVGWTIDNILNYKPLKKRDK